MFPDDLMVQLALRANLKYAPATVHALDCELPCFSEGDTISLRDNLTVRIPSDDGWEIVVGSESGVVRLTHACGSVGVYQIWWKPDLYALCQLARA